MAYLLDKQDVNTLQQVTREVLGDLGGGRANYHREVQRRTVAQEQDPDPEKPYNWQVVTSNLRYEGSQYVCDIDIHIDADKYVRLIESAWQPLTIATGWNDMTGIITYDYMFLMQTGRISYKRKQYVEPLTGVGIGAYIMLQYNQEAEETGVTGSPPNSYNFKLVAGSTMPDLIDYGRRDTTEPRDTVLLAYVDVFGRVTQMEFGIPEFHVIAKKPEGFTDASSFNLIPNLPRFSEVVD